MSPEIEAMAACWLQLRELDEHARARALLWLMRKHQNTGVEVDLRALEEQAIGEPVTPAGDDSAPE